MENVIAKAVFCFTGDESREQYQAVVIQHDESLWFVATWIEKTDTKERTPERIVPLENLNPVWKPDGMFLLKQTIPRELLNPQTPLEQLQYFGVEIFPALAHIHTHVSIH